MKKILSVSFLLFMLICETCLGAVVYPKYSGANKGEAAINERINIVFDNSGHEYVKEMFMEAIASASFAENCDIWLYPIAGNIEPIKLVASEEFMDKNFVSYSKSSNELKPENMMDRAIADLYNDQTVGKKRLVLYVHDEIREIRSEYAPYEIDTYVEKNPGLTFTAFNVGSCIENDYVTDKNNTPLSNYEGVGDKTLSEFLMLKQGYSECSATYNEEEGYLKIDKGQADRNIFITAYTSDSLLELRMNQKEKESCLYLGGCMMDAEGFEKYKNKDKVSGVALSYNHVATDAAYLYEHFVAALFSTDGDCLNPAEEDLYIPLINAQEVKAYYRSIPGVGICSADTVYDTKQDKEIVNLSAPDEPTEDEENFVNSSAEEKPKETGIVAGIVSAVLAFIGGLLGIIFSLLYFGLIAFVIALVVSPNFRGYVHLKVVGSRLEVVYEFFDKRISKIINDIKGVAVKIKGTVTPGEDYIFISKATADMERTNKLSLVIKELERRGIKCWLSEKSIPPGEGHNDVVPDAIYDCTMVLFFVSINSINSAQVESEIDTAKTYKKAIVPVQIEKFDLFKIRKWAHMLTQYQKMDLYKTSEESIKACADAIEARYNKVKSKKTI